MDSTKKRELISFLARFVTGTKWEKIQQIAGERTRYVTVVLENISQELNLSAALRTIECLGVQNTHIITSLDARSKISHGVAKGSDQWLTLKRYRGEPEFATKQCFEHLKSQGYTLVATMPHMDARRIYDISLDKKIALIFGSENDGISRYAQEHADAFATIPMYGFTQSFNVAASVAMCLYDVIMRLKHSSIKWQLSEEEVIELLYHWVKLSVTGADLIEERYKTLHKWTD